MVLPVAGVAWPSIDRLGLGRLPGDIAIERSGFFLYFPLMTSLIISVVLSVILWLVNRWPSANWISLGTGVELDAPALEDIAMRFSSTLAVASSSIALLMCGPGGTAISQAATPRTPLPAHHCPGCAVDSFQSAWRIHDLGGSERNGQSNQMDK
jgi:hypothetical protein